MALIKSTILAQISGSINGITFAHNRGGAYARNRSIPANPGTDRQDQVRTALASMATAWRDTLTDTQRTLWINYAQNVTVLNRLGDTITLSGIAAFQRVNLFRLSTLGTTAVLEPPPAGVNPSPPPTFDYVNVGYPIASDPQLEINLADTVASGYSLAYYYSGPLSPGKNYYRGPYINHGTEPIVSAQTVIQMPEFGNTGAYSGNKVAAKLTVYETSSGLPIWTVFVDPVTIPAQT